ncbi:CPBP family intramembrane glutamic endopeptidase [Natrononativus amylolyticus]|uniref:CPBP family intramembrane glutamic endopeptidase n=1 Tax=Natrononativus amylolyticus TaxID=2963434 RepID=UPI0020CC2624|nr:CPBP family intramembrane glutamic endopeptidase [Natrononativus amylolyticus]
MDPLFQRDAYTRSLLAALLLAAGGLVAAQFTVLPAVFIDPTLAESPADAARSAILAMMALNFVGMVIVGAVYLRWRGYGWSYLDLRAPTAREWAYTLLATVVAIAVMYAVSILSTVLGLPEADNQVIEFIGDDSTMVLLMLVIVFLFNAPAEEFLFRNVIQKRLYAAFTPIGAVIATSAIFAAVHIPTYGLALDGTAADPMALVPIMLTLFIGSIIFGYLYVVTETLVAPIAAHAFYNAFQFALLYLVLEFFPEEFEAAMAVVVDLLPALAL